MEERIIERRSNARATRKASIARDRTAASEAAVPIRPTAPRAREFRRLTRESSPWLARPTLLPARAPMPPSTLPA
jgi:hypothetical protein